MHYERKIRHRQMLSNIKRVFSSKRSEKGSEVVKSNEEVIQLQYNSRYLLSRLRKLRLKMSL